MSALLSTESQLSTDVALTETDAAAGPEPTPAEEFVAEARADEPEMAETATAEPEAVESAPPAGIEPGPEPGPEPTKEPLVEAQTPPAPVAPKIPAGRRLREARLAKGLTFEQLEQELKIRAGYLEALEAMNAKVLPGRAYAVAYLRSYVRFLGLNELQLIDQFREEVPLFREDGRPALSKLQARAKRERPWLAVVALGIVAGGFVGWRALNPPETPAAVDVAQPGAVAPGGGAVAPADPDFAAMRTLEIRADASAWLEVRGPDGTIFFSEVMEPGEVYRPDPGPGWTIHARDGAQFTLFVFGQSVGALGPAGQPVLGRPVDDIPTEPSADGMTAHAG
jgi:transcriptional regulator with XRE-family HTH domain